MANPSKAKGTGGETELRRILEHWGMVVDRTEPGLNYDLLAYYPGIDTGRDPVLVLATRPDHGKWLFTIQPEDLRDGVTYRPWHIEVKRYARFALHAIWNKKFGGKA